MSSFNQLIDVIRSKSALINQESDDRTDLGVLFMQAVKKTVHEITEGADTYDFSDLTVVNLIIMGANEGYDASEMREFIHKLKFDESLNDELEDDSL